MTDAPTTPSSAQRPTIDVVIPTRNRARFLDACLDSVRAQTLPVQTVFVVDDGSTDNSLELLRRQAAAWPNLRIIQTPHRGVSAARNTALAQSTADLVAFIDDDDVWEPEKLAKQAALFRPDRPRLGLVYCGLRRIDLDGAMLPLPVIVPKKRGDMFRDMLEGFVGIAPSTMIARRGAIADVGGFDESLVQGEDRDICLKLARTHEFDYVEEPLVRFRVHPRSTYEWARIHDPEFVLFQRLTIWNKWLNEIEDWTAVLARFRIEARLAGLALMRPPRFDFGLHVRLASSDIELARRLFPTRRDYRVALFPRLFGRRTAGPRNFNSTRRLIAERIILPNPLLLRLAQSMGRFSGVEPPPRKSPK